MFKPIHKTLLVLIMINSLLLSTLYADNVVRDSNGVLKSTEVKKMEKVEDSDLLASLTMLAVGAISAHLIKNCNPKSPDIYTAAVGGAVFVVGEIYSTMKNKKNLDEMMVEITKSSDGKHDQAQIDRIHDLKKSYEEAKDTIQTKKTLQTTAAVAFTAAAGIAAYLAIPAFSPPVVPVCATGSVVSSLHQKIPYHQIFITKILNFIIPNADASMMSLFGLGAGAAASYFLIEKPLAIEINSQMQSPVSRLIVWGSLAGLSYMAAASAQSQIEKINENIKKIDALLKELDKLTKGVQANNVREQQMDLVTFKAKTEKPLVLSSDPTKKTDCLASPGNANCVSVTESLQNIPGFSELPDSFKEIALSPSKIGDGVSGVNNISGATLSAGQSLNGKKNAISKLLDKTKTRLNSELVAKGKPKIDFAKEQNKFLNNLNRQVAQVLRSNGLTADGVLASMTGSSDQGGPTKKYSLPNENVAAAAGTAVVDKNKGFELDFKEKETVGVAVAPLDQNNTNPKFDIGTNDIHTDNGESLFKVISDRYFKSGYPKLLEEVPANK